MRLLHHPVFRRSLPLILVAGIIGHPTLRAEPNAIEVKVADTSTYVQIAKVDLTVKPMSVADGNLVGTHSIDVPLMKSKSEDGQITLPLSQDLRTYLENGGTISGQGVTTKNIEDRTRKIAAKFSPYDPKAREGHIHLTIETSLRVLEFDSTYTLTGTNAPPTE